VPVPVTLSQFVACGGDIDTCTFARGWFVVIIKLSAWAVPKACHAVLFRVRVGAGVLAAWVIVMVLVMGEL